jgi:periplasmic divalent cation tolerance protein
MCSSYSIVYVTVGSKREAEKIGFKLVEERLIACANIFPVSSVYRWKGKVERARELVLVAKTRRPLVKRVVKRIRELHSYEIPCIVSFNIERGLKEFLGWIDESTR